MIRIAAASLLLLTACSSSDVHRSRGSGSPAPVSEVLSKAEQSSMTPSDALARLDAGNRRFREGRSTGFDLLGQAAASASGQSPMAFVLSCVDSRVLPEAAFDCGIGDLFVGRVAGNFENVDLLGSIEYATKVVGTPLVVVLGHSSCGAVKGACDGVELGNLTALLGEIEPAVRSVETSGERSSKNATFVADVVAANVRRTQVDILARSPVIAQLAAEGKVSVVGGVYDLASGAVTWLE